MTGQGEWSVGACNRQTVCWLDARCTHWRATLCDLLSGPMIHRVLVRPYCSRWSADHYTPVSSVTFCQRLHSASSNQLSFVGSRKAEYHWACFFKNFCGSMHPWCAGCCHRPSQSGVQMMYFFSSDWLNSNSTVKMFIDFCCWYFSQLKHQQLWSFGVPL